MCDDAQNSEAKRQRRDDDYEQENLEHAEEEPPQMDCKFSDYLHAMQDLIRDYEVKTQPLREATDSLIEGHSKYFASTVECYNRVLREVDKKIESSKSAMASFESSLLSPTKQH